MAGSGGGFEEVGISGVVMVGYRDEKHRVPELWWNWGVGGVPGRDPGCT